MDSSAVKNLYSNLDKLISLLNSYLASVEVDLKNTEHYIVVERFKSSYIPLLKQLIKDNSELFNSATFYNSFSNDLNSLEGGINYYIRNPDKLKPSKVLENIFNLTKKITTINRELHLMRAASESINEQIQPAIAEALQEIKIKVSQMDNVLLAIETNKTDEIYKRAEKRFGDKARKYERGFYWTLVFTLICFTISLIYPDLDDNSPIFEYVKYVLAKLVIITISITLCTIFGRKGAHFRKLQDQAYQTHLELEAFPIHTNRLENEDKNYLIKELALKYFGKEVDHTQNDKIGDLMQEQVKAGTELIKASAEIVKSVKSSATKEEDAPKKE